MAENRFEGSRISEGTLRPAAQETLGAAGIAEESSAISRDDVRDGALPRESSEAEGNVGNRESTAARNRRRVLAASTLTGDRVRNAAGDDLGTIDEIMIDLPSGRVAYAVLSFGGFLGIGDKLFAVPWNALRIDEGEHEFILDIERSALENAPGFDKNNWPDMADPAFAKTVHEHYGKTPYWENAVTDAGDYTGEKRPPDRSTEFEPTSGVEAGLRS